MRFSLDDVESFVAGGRRHVLTPHATFRRRERNISLKQMRLVLAHPDSVRKQKRGRCAKERRIGMRTLKIVVRERKHFCVVITVMWKRG